jgi:IMP cyclohydrolase
LNASAIPKDDDDEARDALTGEAAHCQTTNPKVTQAIRVVKEYCAIGRGAKKAEDGRQALENTRAVRMAAEREEKNTPKIPSIANTGARHCLLASASGPELWPDVCAGW